MLKNGMMLLAVLALAGCGDGPPDAGSVLDEVASTLGVDDLRSVEYSATGYVSNVNSSYMPDGPGPKFNARFTRQANFERGEARDELVRTAYEDPPRGAGGQPLYRESPSVRIRRADDELNSDALAVTTPQGWVRAAMAAAPVASSVTVDGEPMTLISFTIGDNNQVNGYISQDNLLERIETTVYVDVLGDAPVETTFSDYQEFGSVRFPTLIVQNRGGFPTLEFTVTDVQPNAADDLEVPLRQVSDELVEPQEFAPGIWYLAGGAVNSTLVDFDDFVAVVETGANLARARATIAAVKQMTDKPIFQVNSHHHVDHWAGLRDWIFEGATIITHEMNRDFYEQVLQNPYTIAPDALAGNSQPAKFEYVQDKHVLTDGTRTMEIHWIEGNQHAANMLLSYLPNEKLLIVTDIFNKFYVPRPNDPPPGYASPYTMNLWENIQRLGLDVEHIAPGHGREVVPGSELREMVEGIPVLNPTIE